MITQEDIVILLAEIIVVMITQEDTIVLLVEIVIILEDISKVLKESVITRQIAISAVVLLVYTLEGVDQRRTLVIVIRINLVKIVITPIKTVLQKIGINQANIANDDIQVIDITQARFLIPRIDTTPARIVIPRIENNPARIILSRIENNPARIILSRIENNPARIVLPKKDAALTLIKPRLSRMYMTNLFIPVQFSKMMILIPSKTLILCQI